MKNFIIGFIVVVVAVLALNSDFLGNKKIKTFSVTADTNVSQVKGLSKYVSQEEVDSFAFRHWDIDDDKVMNNEKMENLRLLLKSKNTQEILNFMSDNNISVDEPLHYGVTALMYASFYNDIETAKELINLGADPHKKDRYKLSPMAYAIENNATKSVKLLLENGVKFDEVEVIQRYILGNVYYNTGYAIKSIIMENNEVVDLIYKYDYGNGTTVANTPDEDDDRYSTIAQYFFANIVEQDLIDLAKIVLESGYRPKNYNVLDNFYSIVTIDDDIEKAIGKEKFERVINDEIRSNGKTSGFNLELYIDRIKYAHSLYSELGNRAKPMFDLLLKYNIGGQPSERLMRETYNDCFRNYLSYINYKLDYILDMKLGREQVSNTDPDFVGFKFIYNETPFSINEHTINDYDRYIKFYEKHCGSKELTETIQKEIESFFDKDEYFPIKHRFTDKIELSFKDATFESIEKFIDYEKDSWLFKATLNADKIFLKDKNMTYREYFLKEFENIDFATTSMLDIKSMAHRAGIKFRNKYDPEFRKLVNERKKYYKK